jgi:hypothetical protein
MTTNLNQQTEPFVGLNISFTSWSNPSLDLNRFPTKPFKTIGPRGKIEENTTHRVHCAVSLKTYLWVTAMLKCLQSRNGWGSGNVFYLPHVLL